MKKQIKVLTAAALLTLGASFSALAAETGTWAIEDGEWVCYDADGDMYTNEWCLSEGVEYYVGDDGKLVTSDWVEDGLYYVGSAGTKTVNDWRLAIPYDDEEAEEEWFYFGSNGKKTVNTKKVINNNTYYFDNEGVMLTGWVDGTKNAVTEASTMDNTKVVYTDENGARVKSAWVYTYEPGVDEEDEVDADEYWYYIGTKGYATEGKKSNINGETYFFDSECRMLSGWVTLSGSDYVEIGTDGQTKDLNEFGDVYFCGDSDDGHMKKNRWIKEYAIGNYYAADSDIEGERWFWIEKDGTVFKAPKTASSSNARAITFNDGEDHGDYSFGTAILTQTKKVNGATYLFDIDGEMKSGLVEIGTGNHYYFGGSDDGARKSGSQVITDEYGVDYKFYFSTDDDKGYTEFAGVTGAKSGKLYDKGLLLVAADTKYDTMDLTVNGTDCTFIVNKSGSIQTSNKEYKDGDDVIFNAVSTTTPLRTVSFNDGTTFATQKGAVTVTP